MTKLVVSNMTAGYGKKEIIKEQSITFDQSEIISIIGPNGSGKSTLLKTMARLIKPMSGAVELNGTSVSKIPSQEVAKKIALLPQYTVATDDMTVERLVRMGRNPYKKFLRSLTSTDLEKVEEAMKATDVLKYRHRPVMSLSGGERQRAWLALSLAQEPDILLLDEPTTYLDDHHQLGLMDLVRDVHKKRGTMILMVLHDLNLALRYSHRIVAIKEGAIVGDGTPLEVLTRDHLGDWFHVDAEVIQHQKEGREYPILVSYGIYKDRTTRDIR